MSNVALINESRPALHSGGQVMAIVPQSMEEAYRLANAIVRAGMAPKDINTAEKAMVAIMQGMEVGLKPMQALQRIAVVNGRPTIWGDGAIGLVRGSGLCDYINERIEGEGDKRVAICEAKRKGETHPTTRRFSVDDAKKAGLWNKTGPWSQYPERMLQMRARAFALRDLFADVLGGMYIHEEAVDEASQQARIAPPPPPPPPAAAAPQPEEAIIDGDFSEPQEQVVWEDEGEGQSKEDALRADAMEAASNGIEALRTWFKALSPEDQILAMAIKDSLKPMAEEVDLRNSRG